MLDYIIFTETNVYYLVTLLLLASASLYSPALLNRKAGVAWKKVKVFGYVSGVLFLMLGMLRVFIVVESTVLLVGLEFVQFCFLAFFFGMIWPTVSVDKRS